MANPTTLPDMCALFAGIAPADTSALLECLGAKVVRLQKGETLFRAGEPADRFAVALSGALAVSSYDANGRRSIIKRVRPMEVAAIAQAASRRTFDVTVEAEAQCEALVLKADKALSPCRKACAGHIRLMRNIVSVLADKTLELNSKIATLSKRTIAERLISYLGKAADAAGSDEFSIPFDRQGLADYLCVDRSALSAEIGKLSRAGILTSSKNRFKLQSRGRR